MRALPGVRPVRAQPPTTYQRFAPRTRTAQPPAMARKAQSRRRSVDWKASLKRKTRKTGERSRRSSARRMTPSTRVARSRGKRPAASAAVDSDVEERGRRTFGAGAGRTALGRPSLRIGNWESVASGTAGAGAPFGASGGGSGTGGGSARTPEPWTAASAAAAPTGARPPFWAFSSASRKSSWAEISSAALADGSGAASERAPRSPCAPTTAESASAAVVVRCAVLPRAPVGSRSRYSRTAAPSWSRSPGRRIVSFRILRPATNVPFEEFRSLRTAFPFESVRSAWLLETDSWSTRTVEERLRPSVTSPAASSISRPSTTRT